MGQWISNLHRNWRHTRSFSSFGLPPEFMMILFVIAIISGFVVAGIAYEFVSSVIKTHAAVKEFKKNSNGLPIAEEMGIGGHLAQLFRGDIQKLASDCHEALGNYVAAFYVKKVMVSTTDLDFIQSMIFDEPQHINRMDDGDLPLKEMSPDSIMLARGDRWRVLRKSLAPAFS